MKWCDLQCEHATVDGTGSMSGACRRDIVLHCKKYGKNVKKNSLCIEILREMRASDPEYQRRFGGRNEGE